MYSEIRFVSPCVRGRLVLGVLVDGHHAEQLCGEGYASHIGGSSAPTSRCTHILTTHHYPTHATARAGVGSASSNGSSNGDSNTDSGDDSDSHTVVA